MNFQVKNYIQQIKYSVSKSTDLQSSILAVDPPGSCLAGKAWYIWGCLLHTPVLGTLLKNAQRGAGAHSTIDPQPSKLQIQCWRYSMAYMLDLLVWVRVPWWTQPLQVWDLWQQQDVGLLSAAQTQLLEVGEPVWLTQQAVHPDFCLYTWYHSCLLWHTINDLNNTQIILIILIRHHLSKLGLKE